MPFLVPTPGFSAPAYAVSAPGHAVPQHLRLAPNASSHQRGAGATRPQAAMQGPTAGRQQSQVLLWPRRAQSGVPTPGAQPQQAALMPVQGQAPGPSQVGARQQQQQAAVVPVQAQAQGPSQPQQAGAAQPWGAQGLEQGSAQPTSRPTHYDRTGQVSVQASGPQQVRAALPPAVQLRASTVAAPLASSRCVSALRGHTQLGPHNS